jgi:hypothetical protein
MVDGMHAMYTRDAIAVMDQSDLYHRMSRVVDEVAQLIYHARTQLDEIDGVANEEIEKLRAANVVGGIGAAARLSALVNEIAAIIAKARGAAEALSAGVAGEIASQAARIGAAAKDAGAGGKNKTPSGDNGPQIKPADFKGFRGAGGWPQNGGMPMGRLPPGLNPPPSDTPATDSMEQQPVVKPPVPDASSDPSKGQRPPVDTSANRNGLNPPVTDAAERDPRGIIGPNQLPLLPLGAPTPTTATSSQSMSMSGPTGGLKFPSTGVPSSGMPSGTSSMPPLSPGLSNPASGLTAPPTPAVPPAPPNDFSRGLSAGLGTGGGGGAPQLNPPG